MTTSGEEELIRALHICDDGRDWTGWHAWKMGERRRISEGVFTLPPARPQVVPKSIKPMKKKQRRKASSTVGLTIKPTQKQQTINDPERAKL